jgi:hypothetical protein
MSMGGLLRARRDGTFEWKLGSNEREVLSKIEYERTSGGALLAAKLEQLETFERCIGQKALTEDDVLACMRAANDMRLVLGTRIDVREESRPADFAGDPETESTFELYAYLSWLVESMIDALGEPA